MTTIIKDGQLIISIPINEKPSASGKSIVIASSGGNKPTEVQHNGKVVIVGLNAYISAK